MTKQIKEVMHAGADAHAPDTPITTIAKTMKDNDVGAVPIVENGKVVGMVTDRDITIRGLAANAEIAKLKAKDIMSRDVVCCQDTDTANSAEHLMASKRIRRLPVLDKSERLVGMVSLGDISHAVSDELSGKLAKAVSGHHA